MQKDNLENDLGTLFGSNTESTGSVLSFYKSLYDLPTIIKEYDVSQELFEYCQKRLFFLNILAFQGDRVFFKRFISKELGWELPGGAIRAKGNETIQDAVSRILDRDIPNVNVSELLPIVNVEKHYTYNGKKRIHKGIVIMGRVRYPSASEIRKNEDIKGRFVRFEDKNETDRLNPYDNEILQIGTEVYSKIKDYQLDSIDDEINFTENISRAAVLFHNNLVRPIFGKSSSKIIKENILSYVNTDLSILDVACGDDNFIFELAKKSNKVCIGNDIVWNSIKKTASLKPANLHNLLFTNHDARHLPFKFKFDLTICKNLVHHMQSKEDLEDLFNSIKSVSREILIIDPDDPKKSSFRAKIWNWYYRKILKDQGERFMHKELLTTTLDKYFRDARIELKTIKTIKGSYLLYHILLNDHSKQNALIFDFDGVLVDTEPLFMKSITNTLSKWNISVTEEDYIQTDLQNGVSLLEKLKMNGVIESVDDLAQIKNEIYSDYRSIVNSGVELIPGVKEMLDKVVKKYKLAIASSSKREFIELILKEHSLENYFDVIITRDDVNNLKPSPDCFIRAAKELGLSSDKCVVIEDSMRGVKAALAAKIKAVVIPTELTKSGSYEGATVLESINELEQHLIQIKF